MADPGGGKRVLVLEHREHGLGEGVERGRGKERPGPAVARQLGHDHAPSRGQGRGDPQPVRRGAAEAVDEHERRPRAADEVADRGRPVAQFPRLEALRLVLGSHAFQYSPARSVWTPSSWGHILGDDEWFGRTGRLMPVGSTIEGRDQPV